MANFVMIFRFVGSGLYALYDDMSTASIGTDGSRYIATDQVKGWFYIRTGSSPNYKLEKRSISTFALLAEYSAGSNNYIPAFVDHTGRLYTFTYDGNKVQKWNTNLTLQFEWTLKVGNPLNDQIRYMSPKKLSEISVALFQILVVFYIILLMAQRILKLKGAVTARTA